MHGNTAFNERPGPVRATVSNSAKSVSMYKKVIRMYCALRNTLGPTCHARPSTDDRDPESWSPSLSRSKFDGLKASVCVAGLQAPMWQKWL
jgi:hypothetical protein